MPPDDLTEPETVIPIHVDERTRRAAEAILHSRGLTPSQLFTILMEMMIPLPMPW